MKTPISQLQTRQRRSRFARLLAPLVASLLIVASAGTHASSSSGVNTSFINGSSFGYVGGGPDSTRSVLKGPTGIAEAVAAVAPGGIALNTFVSVTGGPVTLGALANAFFSEQFSMGNVYCVQLSQCLSFAALGVSYVKFDFGIHASGSANAIRTTQFDEAISTVDYSWVMISSQGATLDQGGGRAVARREGAVEEFSDSISSGTAHVRMRPGDKVELQLRAAAGSGASFAEAHATAFVNFANTLRWDGVQAFTAFDSNDQVVSLEAGGRILLAGQDSSFDYWQPATSPLAVPEPDSWALMVAGVALLAWRRRTTRV